MDTDKYLDCLNKVLFSAVKRGHLPRVQSLIEHGADTNICDSNGFSLSSIAEQNGHKMIVNYLSTVAEE
jgi:ankyrin repeat protein